MVYMGCVDCNDQLLKYSAFNHRTLKWWKKVFFRLLNVAMVNAYVLHCEWSKKREKKMLAPNRILYGCYKVNDWRSWCHCTWLKEETTSFTWIRSWHDGQAIARTCPITGANQDKGGLHGWWKACPNIKLCGLILPAQNFQ